LKKILSIDDSGTILQIVKMTLAGKGFDVVVATNGEEGLKALSQGGIDLVVTDINMPVMDGITFIKEAKKVNQTVPIIVLSTESGDELKKEAMKEGAIGWFVKPFKPGPFLDMINDVLS
jgi:two-component system, chemotaxis family, chemotaxis protein CheY